MLTKLMWVDAKVIDPHQIAYEKRAKGKPSVVTPDR
jgi:hypothetical protein